MFSQLGRWCYRHRWIVLGAWIVAVIGLGISISAAGTNTDTEFSLPDVESREGQDIMENHFDGEGAGFSAPLVFVAEQGADDPEVQAEMEELFAFIESGGGLEHFQPEDEAQPVVRVTSPYGEAGAHQVATEGASAGQLAYADIELPSDTSFEESQELGQEIRDEFPEIEGLEINLGGEMFSEFEEPTAEIVGVAFAIVILIVAFGSVIAMGLPIGVGLAGIGVGTMVAGLLTHVFEVPEFAQMLGIMIGLGVGIDYALFIVTRFRENRHRGLNVEESVVLAINTAGRAVTFAGITVVISLLGMVIMQLAFVTGMAVSAATVVLVTMIASVTLLPALIGIVGTHIEVTRWIGLVGAGFLSLMLLGVAFEVDALMMVGGLGAVTFLLLAIGTSLLVRFSRVPENMPLNRRLKPRREKPLEQTVWYRWSRFIQRNPWPSALVGVALLVVLALPVTGLRLGFADMGNAAEGTDARIAYDLLADGFGEGSNGPLFLASEIPEGADLATFQGITEQMALGLVDSSPYEISGPEAVSEAEGGPGYIIETGDGVLAITGPVPNPAETAVTWVVVPPTSPQDKATSDLVHDLRDDVLPAAVDGTDADVAVTGAVAVNIDFTDYLSERLPMFLGAVLALSFLLLMVVFRSVLVPLKAVIMNLLGIGAAYGVVVVVFQWGWAGSLIGVDGGPIEPFMPMMLFAIVFGLSMDYEVFLLSRVKEDWDRTGDSHTSVANGLAATARVITAAALIMMVVFGAFALGDERILKMAGIGLGFAVFLDATVIRMLLVPATMELLGDRNWWLPSWLDRILPTVDVEGHAEEAAAEEERSAEKQPVS